MEKEITVSNEEGLEKGYLQNKIVVLKAVPRGGKMIKDSAHAGYFMWEGASIHFSLPKKERGDLVNPFKTEAERKYFERMLDLDLNVHKKKENFWSNFFVKVQKDAMMMMDGLSFNLADPMDNLRYRVLALQDIVCTDWEKRYSKGHYRFALVDENHEIQEKNANMNAEQEAWLFAGSMIHSPKKMREFIEAYLYEKRSTKEVPFEAEKEWLKAQIKDIMDNDMATFLALSKDEDLILKQFIVNACKKGAIQKEGINNYVIPGETVKHSFAEIVKYIKMLKENGDDTYMKIKIQVEGK